MPSKYVEIVKKAAATGRTLVLGCKCPETAKAALEVCKDGKPVSERSRCFKL